MELDYRRERINILTNTPKEIITNYDVANTEGLKSVRFSNARQGKRSVKAFSSAGALVTAGVIMLPTYQRSVRRL